MKWIIAQYFITVLTVFVVCAYPLNGIASYFHSKVKKDVIWIIGAFLSVAFFGVSISCIIFVDNSNILLWYCLSILTIVFSDIVLLNTSNKLNKIDNPKTLKEHIHNAKVEHFDDKIIKKFLYCRYFIYPIYIVLTILNQLQSLEIVTFNQNFSLYLQVNEYSLIVLFAVDEMIKFFKDSKEDVTNEIQI